MEQLLSSFTVPTLGKPEVPSPLGSQTIFISDEELVRHDVVVGGDSRQTGLFLERAGPREKIFFNPAETTAAIVTCGGLSPGLNNVIQSVSLELLENYGVKRVLGVRHGFRGFLPDAPPPLELTTERVHSIAHSGGTILGSSRGPVDPAVIATRMREMDIQILFCIGGDGTQRGAHAIVEALGAHKQRASVIGIPKTIDNDVPYVWQTFGFSTAVEQARDVIHHADVEAQCFENTVAIVKLMGRDAGFIAVFATLAAQNVDFTLIPEVPFVLDGKRGLLQGIEKTLKRKKSALVVIAEGAGQELFHGVPERFDPSGNRLQNDIGLYLKQEIASWCSNKGLSVSVRYFDPSYSIRAVPANVADAWLCDQLSRAAVHAAMAGKTDIIIGHWYNNLVHVPITEVVATKKRVNPRGSTYQQLLSVTGQSRHLG